MYLAVVDMETKGEAGNVAGPLVTAGTGIHEQEVHTVIPEYLGNMGMAADEYVRAVQLQKVLREYVILRPFGVIGPVTPTSQADVGHQDPKTLTFEMGVAWIDLTDVLAVTIAMDSNQRLERFNQGRTGKGAEIASMPNLIHRFKKGLHIRCEDSMGVGYEADKHYSKV